MAEDEQYTAETFLSFLQKVMATYPTGKLALVLDNADSSCKAASAVSEIRLRVGQFMDEIMKHPHAIIDRLCVRL
ncbi:hypothetical protein P7H19_09940 [Paenibacillus larvae]|nr:hypothetical protein [Paenibacillus larvae]MDT2236539.1 hypothetical protein [Paenibacillus larvae]